MKSTLLPFALLLTTGTAGSQPADFVGSLMDLPSSPSVELRRTNANGTPLLMTNLTRWQPVFEGDQISCLSRDNISILFRSGNAVSFAIDQKALSVSARLDREPGAHQHAAVRAALATAGRPMSSSGSIIQPADKAAVLRTNAVIRWIPAEDGKPFELSSRMLRWRQRIDRPSLGYHSDPDFAAALARAARQPKITLELTSPGGSTTTIDFRVLPDDEERTLGVELKAVAEMFKNDPEALWLARIGIFRRYRLSNNAADASEELLQLPSARSNTNLISVAVDCHEAIRNGPRAQQLRQLLTKISK